MSNVSVTAMCMGMNALHVKINRRKQCIKPARISACTISWRRGACRDRVKWSYSLYIAQRNQVRSEMYNFSNPKITRIRPGVSAVYTTPGNDWPKLLYRFDDIMNRRHSSPIGHRDRDVTRFRAGDWSVHARGSLGLRSSVRVPDRRQLSLLRRSLTDMYFLLWYGDVYVRGL